MPFWVLFLSSHGGSRLISSILRNSCKLWAYSGREFTNRLLRKVIILISQMILSLMLLPLINHGTEPFRTGSRISTGNKMREEKWKLSMIKIKRKTSQKINKNHNKLFLSNRNHLTKHKTQILNPQKHKSAMMIGTTCLQEKNSWKNNNNSKRGNLKVLKNNKSKTNQSSLDNHLITKSIKKLLNLLTDQTFEIIQNLQNSNKSTWRRK